jgi:CheY-like chemotaxis protein
MTVMMADDLMRSGSRPIVDRVEAVKRVSRTVRGRQISASRPFFPRARFTRGGTLAENGLNVLVVEDDETLASLMERILSRAGYGVVMVPSVEAALFGQEAGEFDLIMLDVFMPGIGGLDGIAEFVAWGWAVPIVSMSAGYGDMEPSMVLRAAHKAGAAGVLAKPFKKEELLDLVDGYIGSP